MDESRHKTLRELMQEAAQLGISINADTDTAQDLLEACRLHFGNLSLTAGVDSDGSAMVAVAPAWLFAKKHGRRRPGEQDRIELSASANEALHDFRASLAQLEERAKRVEEVLAAAIPVEGLHRLETYKGPAWPESPSDWPGLYFMAWNGCLARVGTVYKHACVIEWMEGTPKVLRAQSVLCSWVRSQNRVRNDVLEDLRAQGDLDPWEAPAGESE